MKNYISKVLQKLNKLSDEQISYLFKQLLEENSQYLMIFNSYQDAILACGRDYVPWYSNPAANRYFKLSKNKSKSPIWNQVGSRPFSEFLKEHLLSSPTVRNRGLILDEIVLWVKIFPLVGKGKIQGWLIGATDVTEEHRHNLLRRGHENLSQLENMTAILAHEIRNPLTAISIHLQLIQTYRSENGHEQDIEDCLRIIGEEVQHLNSVTGHFLSTARPVQMSPKLQNISDVIMNTAKFLEPELNEHYIKLELKLPNHPIKIIIDGSLIRLALVNLIRNAMAAITHPSGIIVILIKEEQSHVELYVCDNGTGISIQEQENIFNPYYTTKQNGSGLGLTVAYKVAREHKGSIAVFSPSLVLKDKRYKKGKTAVDSYPGTDFVITLPKVIDKKLMIPFIKEDEL